MTDATWTEFRRTRLQIDTDDGELEVAPSHGSARGAYLPGATGPLHVLTAWNPQGTRQSDEANHAADRALTIDLDERAGLRRWRTTGIGAGDDWSEEGWSVEGLSRADVLDLARRFGQRAIFEWLDEPGGFRLVACDGTADEARGWQSRWLV